MDYKSYTIGGETTESFHETLEAIVNELEDEGFVVLCDIDVKDTFARKLDEDFRRYRILGACNPNLAYDALETELQLGALLQWNVIVCETDNGMIGVDAVDPSQLLDTAGNDELGDIAEEVEERFENVISEVTGE